MWKKFNINYNKTTIVAHESEMGQFLWNVEKDTVKMLLTNWLHPQITLLPIRVQRLGGMENLL